MSKEPDDVGYVRRRLESLATSAENTYQVMTDPDADDVAQVRQWLAITAGTLARRAAQLEIIEPRVERWKAIEAAARAHVECLARYTTEAYCDDEERALRVALGLPPLAMGGEDS